MSLDTLNTAITATGLLGCAWWAGAVASMSLYAVPAALSTGPEPQYALRAWNEVYNRGAATGRPLALATFVSLGFVAYRQYQEHKPWKALLFAGASSVAIIPFTMIFMVPTNNALLAAARGAVTISWTEAQVLIERWKVLNMIRGLIPLTGGLIGMYAALAS
ncbi:GNAT N-acetyltransferase [Colletotrichum musicola]|uniref:GNAT N-acetyltransferase n=2 Tax=Colletotrichum orchidearum species complex TaxID=2707337 RepID=A0A8H6J084_9PEZI|nr:GNAT N-acetyltransferase [Colletotrichum musicola]KAF6806765.1 GNAT N-acetyltransferase [Colletotrichum plurivorum]